MRRFNVVLGKLLVLLLMTCSLPGQNTTVQNAAPATTVYHPGDTVRIQVTFQQPANLDQGNLFFELLGEPPEDQQGLEFRFGGKSGQVEKISSTQYRIGEKVPGGLASGPYRLYRVQVMSGNLIRGYEFGSDFQQQVVIRVQNPQITAPPKIQDLQLIPNKK